MVRERVKNRAFHDRHIVPVPLEKESLSMEIYPASAPLEVDIGCGRGRFLLARAHAHPHRNFLGIDRCLLRLRKIDRKATALELPNIRLVQDDALRLLPQLPAESVAIFYVFFPDPWPKRRHHSRRLVSPLFLNLIFQALAPGGVIHICTDHDDYYSAILHHWRPDIRFRECEPFIPSEAEETDFSLIFRAQGKTANRCSFQKSSITVDATGGVN
jgi:tRNA (guanine-N7-)-methyltransferase